MKKKRRKEIEYLTMQLPVVMASTQEFHIVTGAELIADDITQIDGKKVDPEGKYRQPMPVQIARNHTRRMKREFTKGGAAGVANYLLSINQLIKKNDA